MKKLIAFFGPLFAGVMVNSLAIAAEGAATAGGADAKSVAIAISAGVAVAIAAFGAALGQGRVGAADDQPPRSGVRGAARHVGCLRAAAASIAARPLHAST